jgi:hypothetical protein
VLKRADDSIGRFAQMIPVFGKKTLLLNQVSTRRSFDQPFIADQIVSIEAAGELPCRCLSIEGEESFLVRDIVVHNSGGKESAEATIRHLAGYSVYADKVTGHKEVRCEPFAAQVQGGNVHLVAGEWVTDFLDELEVWPSGRWKDQVDAAKFCSRIQIASVTQFVTMPSAFRSRKRRTLAGSASSSLPPSSLSPRSCLRCVVLVRRGLWRRGASANIKSWGDRWSLGGFGTRHLRHGLLQFNLSRV